MIAAGVARIDMANGRGNGVGIDAGIDVGCGRWNGKANCWSKNNGESTNAKAEGEEIRRVKKRHWWMICGMEDEGSDEVNDGVNDVGSDGVNDERSCWR